MSRFEEVGKNFEWQFTKTVILLGLAYGLVGYIYQLMSGASSKNNC